LIKVKLTTFEGPLDLLLFFIKRDEINIYDIPIQKITKEFIEYLHYIQQLDLEIAGDFILMASTLMQIKVRMLLPREVDVKGEEIDPRADLVKALLEYMRYKEVAEEFSFLESNMLKLSYRGNFDYDPKEEPQELSKLLKNISIYDIAKAFKRAIDNAPKEVYHEIKKPPVTIDDQMNFLLSFFDYNVKKIHFLDIVPKIKEKIVFVVTFIALLELVKMGKLGLKESENFNDFEIYIIENGENLLFCN